MAISMIPPSQVKSGMRISNGFDLPMVVVCTWSSLVEDQPVTRITYTVGGRQYSDVWDDMFAMPVIAD